MFLIRGHYDAFASVFLSISYLTHTLALSTVQKPEFIMALLIPRLHDTTGCQTGLTTVLNEQPLFVQPVVKPGCTTRLTTGCIV